MNFPPIEERWQSVPGNLSERGGQGKDHESFLVPSLGKDSAWVTHCCALETVCLFIV